MQLLCNLVTDENSCILVLKLDGIFALYHCLHSEDPASLKYAAFGILNMTISSQKLQTSELICMSGGIAHIMDALKLSMSVKQVEASSYLIRALTYLANYRSPLIKLYFMELSYAETILEFTRDTFGHLIKQNKDRPD